MTFWAAGAIVGSAVIGGLASNSAANTQANAQREGIASQERMFNKQVKLQEPFRQAGLTSQNRLLDLLGLSQNTGAAGYGTAAQPFTMANYQADPGYAFRLSEGIKALDKSAAARGGLLSGNQLRGATEYGQNLASQEYQNAFNRYYAERAAQLNPLQSLMGAGQTSANTLTNAAGNLGAAQSAAATNIGNARASGYMGTANALSSGVGQYLNYRQNQNLVNSFNQGGNNQLYDGGDFDAFSAQQYPE